MTSIQETTTGELRIIEQVMDSLLGSGSTADFCRALVHSDLTGDSAQGCHIYALDNTSSLAKVAGYGLSIGDDSAGVSAWDEGAIPQSIREKAMVLNFVEDHGKSICSVPLMKDQLPVGALALVLDGHQTEPPISSAMAPIVGKIGAFYLETSGVSTGPIRRVAAGDVEDLTSRQITILGLMADGMVNAEIARELLLSESTIRQETVKIYRALGVANRQEASKKGKALGLIPKHLPAG